MTFWSWPNKGKFEATGAARFKSRPGIGQPRRTLICRQGLAAARGAPGCISITQPTGGSEPQRGGCGEGHCLWGGAARADGGGGGCLGGLRAPIWLRKAAGGTCTSPGHACTRGRGGGPDGHGHHDHMRPAGRGIGSRMVRPSPWSRVSKGLAPTPAFGDSNPIARLCLDLRWA